MKRSLIAALSLLAIFAMGVATQSHAQQLYDWEGGLEGWGISGFGNGSEFVAASALDATSGTGSMQMGHVGTGFSWDASIIPDGASAQYAAISAAAANPVGKSIEFDVLWKASLFDTPGTFANMIFSLQSDAGFLQTGNLAGNGDLSTDQTLNISVPLDTGSLAGTSPASSFYRLTIAMNTDATGTHSVLVDNMRITGIPEPTTLGLAGIALTALLARRRR